MILTKKIEKIVIQYNLRIFKNFGYKIGDNVVVNIEQWDKKSHEKIYVSCDICNKVSHKPYRQYFESFKKYNIYCCSSKCSQFKNIATKKEKYNDGTYNNHERYKETCLEKYGVDNSFKDKDIPTRYEFIEKNSRIFRKIRK